jgi:hypothetical protein
MSLELRRATWREISDQRRANVGTAAAAILEKKQRDIAEARQVDAIR